MEKLLVKAGTLVTSSGVFAADLLAEDGRIAAIGVDLSVPGARVLDAAGLLVFPGGVDVHVHMPWPSGSFISTDTFESGSRAALSGGVTTVLDFVIPDLGEPLPAALERKLAQAEGRAWCDYSFHINLRGDLAGRLPEITGLVQSGFPSFKVFMAYDGFRLDDTALLNALAAVAQAGGILTVHAEDGPLADFLTARLLSEGRRALSCYPQARPAECEEQAVARLLAYQHQTGARVHIHHVSTAGAVRQIAAVRAEGRPVSGETCPHYLVFSEQEYAGDPAQAAALVCAPSIKSAADQAALWLALESGALQAVATDHCPYTRAQKTASPDDFSAVPGGLPGVETRLPLLYSAGVAAGRLSLERLAAVWAEEPARLMGLAPRKGCLAVGADADLALLDPAARWTVRADDLHSQTDLSPYEGQTLTGRVAATVLRGQVLVGRRTVEASPAGQLIERTT